MIVGDVYGERVLAYMCRLTSEYGMNPTMEQAELLSRREGLLIYPKDAIKILGVTEWEDVVAFYKKEIGVDAPITAKRTRKSLRKYKRYTDAELLEALVELWDEFNGKLTQTKVNERAKFQPTPSWTALRRLGEPKDWAGIVKAAKEASKPR